MSASDAPQSGAQRPERLLTQNREMKTIGAWNWSLPAWAGRLPDGRTYNTCPSAGICRHVCYNTSGGRSSAPATTPTSRSSWTTSPAGSTR